MSKIFIPSTLYHKVLQVLSILLLVGTFIFLLAYWPHIPENIPMQYSITGEVNRWGDKIEILLLPIIGILVYAIITIVERFPGIWNTGVRITEENAMYVYLQLKNMLLTIKLVIIIIFAFITIVSALSLKMSIWSFVFIMLLVFLPSIYYLIKVRSAR